MESEIQTDTQQERLECEAAAEEAKAETEARRKKEQVKEKGAKANKKFQDNKDNPVFLGNAIAIVGLSSVLGYGAYRKHATGELTWKVIGLWTGMVGAFAIGDYYLSQYVLFTFFSYNSLRILFPERHFLLIP